MRAYIKRRYGLQIRTDRTWDDTFYTPAIRPVEEIVIAHLVYKAPYPFDDDTYNARRYDLEFYATDWTLYLLLTELKGRVLFGRDSRSQKEERDTLKLIASDYMNMSYYEIIMHYAELCTKMTRRTQRGLASVPVIPKEQDHRVKSLLKRDLEAV